MPSGQKAKPNKHQRLKSRTKQKMPGRRNIISIDEKKCNGCGLCIPNCPEGALGVIDGKARLISDIFCDGLGACIGHCPAGAITIEEREAEPYDERKAMENIARQGQNVIKAHLEHLREHNQAEYLNEAIDFLREKGIKNPLEGRRDDRMKQTHSGHVCPGAALRDFSRQKPKGADKTDRNQESQLRQWPVQLSLLPPDAPFFSNAHLLVSADCVPFADPNFHNGLLRGKSLVIGCPKLDDVKHYTEKLSEIFRQNRIKSVTVAIMEVPCCHGLYAAVEQAVRESGKKIPIIQEVIGVDGVGR